jgi:hypothetical protein
VLWIYIDMNDDDLVDGVRIRLRTAPPTGLFFIPRVIHEHKEPIWNGNDMVKLLIRQPELSDKPTSRAIW